MGLLCGVKSASTQSSSSSSPSSGVLPKANSCTITSQPTEGVQQPHQSNSNCKTQTQFLTSSSSCSSSGSSSGASTSASQKITSTLSTASSNLRNDQNIISNSPTSSSGDVEAVVVVDKNPLQCETIKETACAIQKVFSNYNNNHYTNTIENEKISNEKISNANSDKCVGDIMELLHKDSAKSSSLAKTPGSTASSSHIGSAKTPCNTSSSVNAKSPNIRIKRYNGHWQEFIEREQSTVDHLLEESFAKLCQDLEANISNNNQHPHNVTLPRRVRASSVTSPSSNPSSSQVNSVKNRDISYATGSLTRKSPFQNNDKARNNIGHQSRTMPRSPMKRALFGSGQQSIIDDMNHSNENKPPGIEELETLYAPMKDLNHPLPQARHYRNQPLNHLQIREAGMPALHPLGSSWGGHHRQNPNQPPIRMMSTSSSGGSSSGMKDDDNESEICSVMGDIPPPLAPIQSHAVLEESLGHEIPPLPRTPGLMQKFPGPAPPLPPKRTSSKLSIFSRPNHLSVKDNGIYANPKPLINRSSLMSTGSSESSGSSTTPFDHDIPITPVTPNSEQVFSWPNYAPWNAGNSPVPSDVEHRSVSQIGEPPDSGSDCSGSGANPEMNNSLNTSTSSSAVYVKMQPFPNDSKESHYMNVLYSAVQRQGGGGSVENALSPYIPMTAIKGKTSAIYEQPEPQVSEVKIRNAKSPLPIPAKYRKRLSSNSSSKSKALTEFRELMAEVAKKRQYRVGLNLFNTKPEMGIEYLVQMDFVELSPSSVAKFLHQHSGLSRDKIGEYLGNLQSPFSMKVLSCYMQEFNFTGQRIDKALRKMLESFRVPGEAQKIEKIMEEFGKRYNKCNPQFATKLKSQESVVTLAFAIMLLNTDLHTPNIKVEKKMSVQDFMNNLKGVDNGNDFDPKLLKGIYKGIKKHEFEGGVDHVLQTQLIQQSIHGKRPLLSEPQRRLVCLCRLAEVMDINTRKKEEGLLHQRDIFLFNDLLVVTKQSSKSTKHQHIYSYRDGFPLNGLEVTLFHTPVYDYGVQVTRKRDNAVLITLNASSEHDRYKFVMDLQESIFEMDQMEEAKSKLIYK